jgi:hypothetical protein
MPIKEHLYPGETVIENLAQTADNEQLASVITDLNNHIILIENELGAEGASVAVLLKKLVKQTQELKHLQLEGSSNKRLIHDLMLDNEVVVEEVHTELEEMVLSLQKKVKKIDELVRVAREQATAVDILVSRMIGDSK